MNVNPIQLKWYIQNSNTNASCKFWVVGHIVGLFAYSYVQVLGSGSYSGSLLIAICNFRVVGHIVGHFS